MADHYGTSELIIGEYNAFSQKSNLQLFTKWVPSPGKITRELVRESVELA